jgi:Lon protease-like protein
LIPVFPLPGAVLLPRGRLPLHIFEPRYLAMLDDALKSDNRMIGMIQPIDDGADLHQVGCAGRVTSFSELDDGRYMVTLTGVSRFRLTSEVEGFTPYRRFDVDWSEYSGDLSPVAEDESFNRDHLFSILRRYLQAQDMSTDWDGLQEAEPEMLVNALVMLCPLSVKDKQGLLEAKTLSDRRKMLETLLEFSLLSGVNEEIMQ